MHIIPVANNDIPNVALFVLYVIIANIINKIELAINATLVILLAILKYFTTFLIELFEYVMLFAYIDSILSSNFSMSFCV